MSILNKILKTFIGDKTKKDLSKITPLVKEINEYERRLEKKGILKRHFTKKIDDK